MRKVISDLGDEHRAVLQEAADLGTAVFSSGLHRWSTEERSRVVCIVQLTSPSDPNAVGQL